MSKEKAKKEDAPAKKGGMLKIAIFALLLLAVGGGGTYGAIASGMLGVQEGAEEDFNPKLVKKGDDDPYPYGAGDKDKDKAPIVYGVGGGEYRTAYFDFKDDFTSNLSDGIALVQVSLAASTHYDGRVLMWLDEHETAVRSRILVELAETDHLDLSSDGGKERLQERLTQAINKVLEEREGFGGVNNVYFRSFIVQ